MKYPDKIKVNDNIYKINTDYRVALSCFKALYDVDINDTERALAIVTLLLGNDVAIDDLEKCLEKCSIFLRCGKEVNDDKEESDMDYLQDENAIRTSIRQCYHLDLNKKEYLHWWEYNELIEGLTEETLLSKIRELRTYDLSNETDENRKRKIEEAQKKVSLKKKAKILSDEEKESVDKFCELMGIERK